MAVRAPCHFLLPSIDPSLSLSERTPEVRLQVAPLVCRGGVTRVSRCHTVREQSSNLQWSWLAKVDVVVMQVILCLACLVKGLTLFRHCIRKGCLVHQYIVSCSAQLGCLQSYLAWMVDVPLQLQRVAFRKCNRSARAMTAGQHKGSDCQHSNASGEKEAPYKSQSAMPQIRDSSPPCPASKVEQSSGTH